MNKRKLPIPDFKSVEDYKWQPVTDIKFSKNLKSVYTGGIKPPKSKVMQMRLDAETVFAMEKVARQKGVGTSTAARMLIRERLNQMKII